MKANYHTHTSLCGHASGEIEDYIKFGIENGLEILGFTDHVPYLYPNGYVSSGIRMKIEQADYYINSLLHFKEKYKDKIKILIGFEVEYYPELFSSMLEYIKKYPIDYLICGQHFLDNEYDTKIRTIAETENKFHLTNYIDTLCTAIDTGLFAYLAHPDLMNYRGDGDFYIKEYTRLCKYAKLHNIPLEINILGLKTKRNYPNDLFWEIASGEGNDVIIACDAHNPESVANPEEVKLGYEYAKKFNIKPIEYLEI